MAKGQKNKNMSKKKPQKTLKEKRQAKKKRKIRITRISSNK